MTWSISIHRKHAPASTSHSFLSVRGVNKSAENSLRQEQVQSQLRQRLRPVRVRKTSVKRLCCTLACRDCENGWHERIYNVPHLGSPADEFRR